MKNITVTVDSTTYRRARVRAAELQTSVSALVKEFLTCLAETESEFDRLARQNREVVERIRSRKDGFSASKRLSRDQVHDRDALR